MATTRSISYGRHLPHKIKSTLEILPSSLKSPPPNINHLPQEMEKNPKFAAPAANCKLKKKRREKEKEEKRGEKKRRKERKCRRFCGRSPFLGPQKNKKRERSVRAAQKREKRKCFCKNGNTFLGCEQLLYLKLFSAVS